MDMTDNRYNFLPHTQDDRDAMLQVIGVDSIDVLFADIPASLRGGVKFNRIPEHGLSEWELQEQLKELAAKNRGAGMACFLGGGAYSRFIPPAVNTIAGRSEFYTAYTPYQPEIAQGTLQYTYEFQTMICELTGMDIANASVYDGAVAVAEAALMALRVHKKRDTVLIASTVHPDYRYVLETYLDNLGGLRIAAFDPHQAFTLPEGIAAESVAGVILQQPDYFGILNSTESIRAFCAEARALFIVSADPVSLGILDSPGNYGADIVVGDIQPLGNHLSFGGPYGGYMACRKDYMRQLPGRLVGRTVDRNGNPCYTLTLQTREQHIKRERATSNICTNQALNILKATVYMTLMGPRRLREVANISMQRAHTLAEQLTELPGAALTFGNRPFLWEFAIDLPVPVSTVLNRLERENILGGIPVVKYFPDRPNTLLVSCTELTTPDAIARYVAALGELLNQLPESSQDEKKIDQVEVSCS